MAFMICKVVLEIEKQFEGNVGDLVFKMVKVLSVWEWCVGIRWETEHENQTVNDVF